MIYDLPKIESEQILKAHQNRIYRVERDRLKPRLFIYLNSPVINYHGLNLSDAKKYVFADSSFLPSNEKYLLNSL